MIKTLKLFFLFSLLSLGTINSLNQGNQVPVILPLPKVDLAQVSCLAKNIFYEAASESVLGQAAVARVVLNRVAHGFAPTPCKVIYQSINVEKTNDDGETDQVKVCQFSWVCEGRDEPSKSNPRYLQAKKIAYEVLAFDAYKEVVPRTTLFFHNLTVNPGWAYKQVAQIDNHVFYSKEKRPNK